MPSNYCHKSTEAVVWRRCVKKVFLKISQNSDENTCVRVSFLIKLQELGCNFSKTETPIRCFPVNFGTFLRADFFYRTTPVAASESIILFKLIDFNASY